MTTFVIHEDDVGFCQGANDAFVELSRRGTVSSGSVMVPCPWFHDLAERVSGDDSFDVGVHLTLTSEHRGYRWSPLTRPTPAAGLVDDDGYMWRTVAEVRHHAEPDAVEAEWRAQIDRALSSGLAVSHLDAHMGAALAPEWCDRYVAVAVEYGVPALITSTLAGYGPNNHLEGATEEQFASSVGAARDAGMPIFDAVLETDFGRPRGAPVDYASMLTSADAEPGYDLVYCAFHPCRPGPGEVERIDVDTSHVRTDEYHLFGSGEWAAWLAQQPFDVVTMRELAA